MPAGLAAEAVHGLIGVAGRARRTKVLLPVAIDEAYLRRALRGHEHEGTESYPCGQLSIT